MANGSGVSMAREEGGKWRVRWREAVAVDGVRKWKQRERVVSSEQAAIDLRSTILRAIETTGAYVDPVRDIVVGPSIEALGVDYVNACAARGIASSTIANRGQRLKMALRTLRTLLGLVENAPVPADVLSRDLVARGVVADRTAGYAESTIRLVWGALIDVWMDGYDTREGRGVPTPPRKTSAVLPRTPRQIAPPAPSLAEVDAMIRHIDAPHATKARACAIIMRYTGLRVSQVMALRRADLDTTRMLLTVRTGKSAEERAEAAAAVRIIPITPAFLADIAPMLSDAPKGAIYRERRHATRGDRTPSDTIKKAWQRATDASEARLEVWRPPARGNARPDHALRAALISHLKANGVPREIRAAIVGQHDDVRENVETKHYAGSEALIAEMRKAVALIPPVDRKHADAAWDNVVSLDAARAR